jgi:polyhydroxybutyrate depolymerase
MRAVALVLVAAACGGSADHGAPSALVVARPYNFNVPGGYRGQPTPLVLLLHGYGENGVVQDAYFGFTALSESETFLYAYPDGTIDSTGKHFWNATDDCCDLDHTGVDDVAYLNAVIDDMERQYNVDKSRVYVTGHSNGGFMSHRLACDSTKRIAAIMSLAGATWKDQSKCNPSEPIAVLQVHGDMDAEVPYQGAPDLPSAMETVGDWATKNGCTGTLTDTGETKDLDSQIDGAETQVSRYACTHGAAELWTMRGDGHIPNFIQPDWGNAVWSFLSAFKR